MITILDMFPRKISTITYNVYSILNLKSMLAKRLSRKKFWINFNDRTKKREDVERNEVIYYGRERIGAVKARNPNSPAISVRIKKPINVVKNTINARTWSRDSRLDIIYSIIVCIRWAIAIAMFHLCPASNRPIRPHRIWWVKFISMSSIPNVSNWIYKNLAPNVVGGVDARNIRQNGRQWSKV